MKLDKLLAHLTTLNTGASSSQDGGEGPIKSVVFSQFTKMLDLACARLNSAGVPHIRIDGSTPAAKRGALLAAFSGRAAVGASSSAGAPRVAVISLRAGGVGMNLVAASEVHLLDPWWNPATEEQARTVSFPCVA